MYNREESIKLLQERYGYIPYGEKHEENLFTVWFQNVWLYRIHKIDKRRAHYSSMINSGQMTREEAVEKLKVEPEPVEIEMNLGVESITLHDYRDYPTSEFLWNLLSKLYGIVKTAKRSTGLIG